VIFVTRSGAVVMFVHT